MFLNPLYTGGLFHCFILGKSICHFRSVIFFFILSLIENPVGEQWRTLCGILSGSALFAYDPFTGFQVRIGADF